VNDLAKPTKKLTDEDRKRLTALTDKAQKGDRKALAEASEMLTEHRLWHVVGDMGRYAQEAWLDAAAGSNPLARKALEEQLRELRNGLRDAGDSPLERVLIDRLVACWLQANYADWQHGALLKKGSYSFAEGRYNEERQDRAHRRVLQAAKTLATVRRLLTPAVQINVGQNQIITQTGGTDLS
jgi:hypothetical protein